MGIKIGNNNTIKNSNISETTNGDTSQIPNKKANFYEKHPVLCSFLISLAVWIVLLFSFWNNIIDWIERLF